jgi:hypothetical protein
VEIFNWVENNKPKFDNNELENYRITIDGQEMSLQKGFNMLLASRRNIMTARRPSGRTPPTQANWMTRTNTSWPSRT